MAVLTNIVDVLLDADGTPAQGQVTIYWPEFMAGDTPVTQGQRTYDIVDGKLNLHLYPTVNAQPVGSYYTATFELSNGAIFDEYWLVASQPIMKLNQIRSMFPPAPGLFINANQITGGGAQNGQFLGWNGSQFTPMYVTTLNVSPNTIGLLLTSSGSDVSVSASPAMLGGQMTLNIPDAGAAARGVVNTDNQTFAGAKTFQNQVGFMSAAYYMPVSGSISLGYGAFYLDSQNRLQARADSFVLSTPGAGPATLQADGAVVKHVDVSQAALSSAVSNPSQVVLPGPESLLLPSASSHAHGIGVDSNGWLWLGSGGAFASLRPDAAWVANWIDLSPYQHPIAANAEATPSQASMVLYQDASQWIGMGVDASMRIWFRMGPNGAGVYYYLAPDGGSMGVYTWANSTLAAQRAGINLIAGQYVTVTAVDNPGRNTVDVTIAAAGNLVDPTTAIGDLIVRGGAKPDRLPVGSDGYGLQADSTQLLGISWKPVVPLTRRVNAGSGLTGGGNLSQDVSLSANVLSVFSRTGNVVLTGTDITNAGGLLDPTTTLGDLIVRGAPATKTTRLPVGADGSVLTADSTQSLGVKWGSAGALQTPWLQNVNAAGFSLNNAARIGVGTATPHSPLAVVGLMTYADNASALAGGLAAGDFYTDGAGAVKVVF